MTPPSVSDPSMTLDTSKLNAEQKEGALYTGGPLLVLAGAGTGKTRVITYRIAHLIKTGVPADRILAVTFTNKAAGEMRHRVEELSPGQGALVWVHTFHAFATRVLRRHHELLKLSRSFTIYDQSDQKRLVTQSMKELGLEDQANKAGMYVSIISRAKDDLLDAESYMIHAMTTGDSSRETAARIYSAYQKKLDAAGALDFGDLLLKVCHLLRDHREVLAHYQEHFLHLLVDEYQDTNHAQYTLMKSLAAKHKNICVVGDDDQSVYSWRGASIRNILEFERDFHGAKVVTLEQNYRSTSLILEAAAKVIRNNKSRKIKTLWTEKPAGESVHVQELPNEMEEASWVVRRLNEALDHGRSLNETAIFYRTNAQSRSFEEALRRAGMPYTIVGAMRFYERKEIKDALCYARNLLNSNDSISLARVLNIPARGIGKTSLERIEAYGQARGLQLWECFKQAGQIDNLTPACRKNLAEMVAMMERLREAILGVSASRAIALILEQTGYWAWLEGLVETDPEATGRLNNLQELLNAVKEYEDKKKSQGESVDLGQYLEGVSLHTDLDAYDPSKPAVTMMTVHLAKGLEYPMVFLTGLEEGLFPIGSGSSSPEDLEEERRLCYVGITRARETLYLTHTATRRLFGQVYANLPSRFILEAQLMSPSAPLRPSAGQTPLSPRALGQAGLAAAAPSTRLAAGKVRLGMRVRHPDFGLGTVTETSGSGDTLKATVRFDGDERVTKLLVRYAPLEPV